MLVRARVQGALPGPHPGNGSSRLPRLWRRPGRQQPVPFAIHAHGAREHVPIQRQVPVTAVKPGARHAAPGGQAHGAGPGVVTRQASRKELPSKTSRRRTWGVAGLGLPQARVRPGLVRPRVRAQAAALRLGRPQPQGLAHQPRQQGGQPVRGGLRLRRGLRLRGGLRVRSQGRGPRLAAPAAAGSRPPSPGMLAPTACAAAPRPHP